MDNINGMKPDVDNVREATDRFVNEARTQVNSAIDEAAGLAGDLISQAEGWLGRGKGKNLGIVALVAAAGVLGYLVGRGGSIESGRRVH